MPAASGCHPPPHCPTPPAKLEAGSKHLARVLGKRNPKQTQPKANLNPDLIEWVGCRFLLSKIQTSGPTRVPIGTYRFINLFCTFTALRRPTFRTAFSALLPASSLCCSWLAPVWLGLAMSSRHTHPELYALSDERILRFSRNNAKTCVTYESLAYVIEFFVLYGRHKLLTPATKLVR